MKNLIKSIVILLFIGMVACDNNDVIPPIPPSDGDIIEAEVGGPNQPNQVFIDLSTAISTVVPRTKWDLAFATGSEYTVAINYAAYMSARPTDQNDLAEINSTLVNEDYKAAMATGPDCNVEWIDDPSGDLSKTAFGTISTTEANNMVFVINRGYMENGMEKIERGFVKVRVTREAENYVVSYGDIDDETFTTVTIAKDPAYNFVFFSFDDGLVNIEPEKGLWDVVMTTGTLLTAFGPGELVPYNFKDLGLTNQQEMKIKAVEITTEITYDGFDLDAAKTLTLESNRTGIGSSWRKFNGSQTDPGYNVAEDIFYVIEDPDQNFYKLKYTKMHCITAGCAGERGYPEFTYELLK
jgi:hypothetical protein